MCAVFLIDTDSLLGLAYSRVGQSYLKQAQNLRITEEVKEEVCGLKNNPETRKAALEVENSLKANSNVDFDNPLTQSRVSYNSGGDTKGEQSIHDYIIFGEKEVAIVFFFDSDMRNIMGRLNYPPPRFDVVTSVFTYLHSQLTKQEMREETAKIANGRNWLTKRNLKDLFIESGIMTDRSFNYNSMSNFCRRQTPDL